MIPSQEKEDVTPLCPHCGQEMHNVWYREVESVFGKRYMYFCPTCRKVLGISHRKGYGIA